VDFTREPIIETIITPKEGYKLVIKSSKSAGQEEYFADAVEIVAFGKALFFRSLERPKAFLVPVSDYEILEVREARMVLKNAGLDRSIKIGGGREGGAKAPREVEKEAAPEESETEEATADATSETRPEGKGDKKRDRRRHSRKRRGREEVKEEAAEPSVPSLEGEQVAISLPDGQIGQEEAVPLTPAVLSTLLQPPPTLISETINRYRQNAEFKGAFFLTEEEQYKPHDKVQELLNDEDEEEPPPSLRDPYFEPESPQEEPKNDEIFENAEDTSSLTTEEPFSQESEPVNENASTEETR
jgi:hypothetical protein